MSEPITYSVADAAAATSLSIDYIKRAIHATQGNVLPAKKAGTKYLIRRKDLEAWIDAMADA